MGEADRDASRRALSKPAAFVVLCRGLALNAHKPVVCYSGGHSSALVAIETARRFGAANTVLLNHDIHFTVEHADVKRFKREVAEYLGIEITFASHRNPNLYQFDICVAEVAFKGKDSAELCTSRLKMRPFQAWLAANAADRDCTIYYGFDNTPRESVHACSAELASHSRSGRSERFSPRGRSESCGRAPTTPSSMATAPVA